MAINTLKDVNEIDGHNVFHALDDEDCGDLEKLMEKYPIIIAHDDDMLLLKMMTKPVREGGSGCQLTTLIEAALIMIKYLNDKFPCEENNQTINNLVLALEWQNMRTIDRKKRNVEGENKL